MSKYEVTVNDSLELELSETDVLNQDIIISDKKNHLIRNNYSYSAEIISNNFFNKEYKVKINSNIYKVRIGDSLDQLIKELGFELGASKQINIIKAPMPGLILSINVTEGQEVKENDSLLILEAMKMENTILSPRSGIVKHIGVKQGEAIDKGHLLIEFE